MNGRAQIPIPQVHGGDGGLRRSSTVTGNDNLVTRVCRESRRHIANQVRRSGIPRVHESLMKLAASAQRSVDRRQVQVADPFRPVASATKGEDDLLMGVVERNDTAGPIDTGAASM